MNVPNSIKRGPILPKTPTKNKKKKKKNPTPYICLGFGSNRKQNLY